jgi:hypothetical protein
MGAIGWGDGRVITHDSTLKIQPRYLKHGKDETAAISRDRAFFLTLEMASHACHAVHLSAVRLFGSRPGGGGG